RQRPQAYAIDSVVQIIDTCVVLVATFESSVMCFWMRRVPFGQRSIFFHDAEHSRRACVDDSRNRGCAAPRLEDVDRAYHIDHCAQTRVAAADWHLQPRQVNEVSNSKSFDDRGERTWIGNVAGDHNRSGNLAIIHYHAQTPRVGALI